MQNAEPCFPISAQELRNGITFSTSLLGHAYISISHHVHTGQLCLFSYGKPRTGSLEHRNFNHVELANEGLAPMLGKTRIPREVLQMC